MWDMAEVGVEPDSGAWCSTHLWQVAQSRAVPSSLGQCQR